MSEDRTGREKIIGPGSSCELLLGLRERLWAARRRDGAGPRLGERHVVALEHGQASYTVLTIGSRLLQLPCGQEAGRSVLAGACEQASNVLHGGLHVCGAEFVGSFTALTVIKH